MLYFPDMCSPGFYNSETGLPPCKRCPADTFSISSKMCWACANGTSTVGIEGADGESACKGIYCCHSNMSLFILWQLNQLIGVKVCQPLDTFSLISFYNGENALPLCITLFHGHISNFIENK